MEISVVVPVYGCPAAVRPLTERLVATLTKLTDDYEIILVNDACPRNSWAEIQQVCADYPCVIGLELSRNFGQIHAITAGLDYASGNWVVVMDCDLQDRPEGIIDLYNKAQEGYDVVFSRRMERKDSRLVKFLSKTFYKVYDYFTDGQFDNTINNFSISRREVIDQYCTMREQNRAYTLFLRWLGYRQTAIELEADKRLEGKSSYNFKRKTSLALQIITSQSNKPLLFAVKTGFFFAFLSFVFMTYQVIKYIVSGNVPAGWTSQIVSTYFLGGLILMAVGVIGVYIGYIFNEVKRRPLYVVRTVLNGHPLKEDNKP